MRMGRTAGGTVRDGIDAADQAIMARLSAESSPMLDRFLPVLSRSADFFVLWIGIAAALAASNDERGRRAAPRGLAGMAIASTASNVLAKGLVRRPRPAGEVPSARRPGRTPVTTSFPSGHAAAAAAFATGVGLEMPALAAPVGVLAVAVGVARVVNGVHYPSDIAGGWVFGVGVGILTLRWWPLRRSEPARPRRGPATRHPRRPPRGTRPRDELRRARPQMNCWSTVRTSQLEIRVGLAAACCRPWRHSARYAALATRRSVRGSGG